MNCFATIIDASADAVCRRAAAMFVIEVSRLTPYSASLTDCPPDDALAIAGSPAARLRVSWTWGPTEAAGEGAGDDATGVSIAVLEHYTRTLRVLACNPAAARVFLDLLDRQPRDRTAGHADRPAASAERRSS